MDLTHNFQILVRKSSDNQSTDIKENKNKNKTKTIYRVNTQFNPKTKFVRDSLLILNELVKLKKLLQIHQKDYINANSLVASYSSRMKESERDYLDKQIKKRLEEIDQMIKGLLKIPLPPKNRDLRHFRIQIIHFLYKKTSKLADFFILMRVVRAKQKLNENNLAQVRRQYFIDQKHEKVIKESLSKKHSKSLSSVVNSSDLEEAEEQQKKEKEKEQLFKIDKGKSSNENLDLDNNSNDKENDNDNDNDNDNGNDSGDEIAGEDDDFKELFGSHYKPKKKTQPTKANEKSTNPNSKSNSNSKKTKTEKITKRIRLQDKVDPILVDEVAWIDELEEEEMDIYVQENMLIRGKLEDKKDQVMEIESKLQEISGLQAFFSEKVLEQSKTIEFIYDNSVSANQSIQDGNDELRQAVKESFSMKRLLALLILTLALCLLFLHYISD
ncbi:syntaxin-18 [Anaeramoeba flamelloides]|uniref:Syntaxin-18 n=1 Tax=Anaeramoeba flamelloides TaxID=1746091 RepID=A0AAV7YG36_9EUKA|nr:syntaxin-18 [Anaeramoeba flamelloides]